VIYLTLPMNAAIRGLSLLLLLWFTATAAVPACCWSSVGHGHQPQQHAPSSSVEQHAHHHHDADVGSDVSAPIAEISPLRAHDCAAELVPAIATARPVLSFADVRAAFGLSSDALVPRVSAASADRLESAPPGRSRGAAFLNPLRI
jgi:hypothetical protein